MRKTIYTDGDQLTPIRKAKEFGFTAVRCHHDGNDYAFMQQLIDAARTAGIQLWFSMDWDFNRMGASDGGNHRDEICARYDFLYNQRDVVIGLCAEETEYHPNINLGMVWPLDLIKAHFAFVHQTYPFFETQLIVCGARDRSTLAKQTMFEYYLGTQETKYSNRSDFEANVEAFVKSLTLSTGATKSLGLCLKAKEDDVTAGILKYQIDVFKAALAVHQLNLQLVELVAWVWDWDSHPDTNTLCDTKSIQQAWKEVGEASIVPQPPPPADMTPAQHLEAVVKKLQPQSLSVEHWQALHRTKEALFWLNEGDSLR